MRIDIITIFPGSYVSALSESVIARAVQRGIVGINIVDLRQYTHDRHRTVDDRPYGGGPGMVMKPEPLFEAVEDIAAASGRRQVILLTPQGAQYNQKTAEEFARNDHLIFICGHYEGVDERVREALVDREVSIGDFIMTNGNLAAMMIADSVVRLLPGVLGSPGSAQQESFDDEGLLDYPQYTRPHTFRGMTVPDALLSGDHKRITEWRHRQREIRTLARRPDLITDRNQKNDKARMETEGHE